MSSMSDEQFNRICNEVDDLLCIHLNELLQQKMPNENQFGAGMYILTRLVTKFIYKVSADQAEQLNTFSNIVKKMLAGIEKTSIQ